MVGANWLSLGYDFFGGWLGFAFFWLDGLQLLLLV